MGGAGAEEAECVGVDGLRNAVALEGFAEVLEVGPGGVAVDEAASDVEARVVIDGQEEGLFYGAGPPLVDGAVVLEEFAETGVAQAAIGARFFPGRGHEVGQVGFDVGFGVEGVESVLDEVKEMTVGKLALFIRAIHSICGRRGTRFSLAFWRRLSTGPASR